MREVNTKGTKSTMGSRQEESTTKGTKSTMGSRQEESTTKGTKSTMGSRQEELTTKGTKSTMGSGRQQATGRETKKFEPVPAEADRVARAVVDAALKVHRVLGPGLLESVYEVCLTHELNTQGLRAERQVTMPVTYEGVRLDAGLRLDILVERLVIVEVKAVEQMNPVHEAQLLTYLRLSGLRVGLLINFNVKLIRDGIKRMVL